MTSNPKLSLKNARETARHFLWEIADKRRQWTVSTLEGYLPYAWNLRDVEDSDLFPLTVKHVADVLRNKAKCK